MRTASACPDNEQLQQLIQGELSPITNQTVTEHVGLCETCQDVLQKIASGDIQVDQLAAELDSSVPPADSAYWKAMARLEGEFRQPTDTARSLRETEAPRSEMDQAPGQDLDFLQPSDDPAYIGKLQHFLVARVIGRGGMGIVVEAFDTHLQRNVAIKVLNPRFQQNETARQRFCREGRAAAAISHEHVVSMHHVAKADENEVAFLVMQLIEGDTLENRMTEGHPLPAKEVARIGMQMAAGLAAAHSRGMVHRDIKPANILIEAETDRVKLTDFGLARATDDIRLTKTGMVTGTPLYMSPEQAMGGTADERSDLFSLGAVLYEMATGASPFQAPTAIGVMKRIMDEMPEPPNQVNPDIGKPLSDIIMALLAKDPAQRPRESASIATALAGIVSEFGPISPLQVPAVAAAEAKKLSGDHRVIHRSWILGGWLASAVAVVALIVAGILWANRGVGQPQGDPFPSVLLAGNPGTVWSVDFSPSGNEVVAAIEDGSVRLWDIDQAKVIKSFNAHRGIVWMARFHPTLPVVATAGDDGFIKLWDRESFELKKEWQIGSSVRGVAFSPDGQRLVSGDREGNIRIYEIESGKELKSTVQNGSILAVDFSPSGRLIATGGTDKIVRLWDAETLEERQTMSGHDGPIYGVRFADGADLLATVGWNKNIHIWDTQTGEEITSLAGNEGDVWGVAFCGEGSHLVTGGQDGAARVYDVATGEIITTLRGHSSAVHDISLDRVAYRIATSSRDGSIRVWDMSQLAKSAE